MRVYNSGAWNMIYLIWMLVARGYISWKTFESCPSKRSPSLNLSFVRRADSLDFAQNNTSPFLVHTSPLQCKISARKTVWVYDASSFLSSNSLVSTPTAALLKVARTHSNSPFRPPTNPIRGVETLEPAPISPIRSTLISSVVSDRVLSSSLAPRLSTSLLNLWNGVNRVSRGGASQVVSRDPDIALAELLESAVYQPSKLRDFDVPDLLNLSFHSLPTRCSWVIRVIVTFISPVYSVNLTSYFAEKWKMFAINIADKYASLRSFTIECEKADESCR